MPQAKLPDEPGLRAERLRCQITVLSGAEDPLFSPAQLEGWTNEQKTTQRVEEVRTLIAEAREVVTRTTVLSRLEGTQEKIAREIGAAVALMGREIG